MGSSESLEEPIVWESNLIAASLFQETLGPKMKETKPNQKNRKNNTLKMGVN